MLVHLMEADMASKRYEATVRKARKALAKNPVGPEELDAIAARHAENVAKRKRTLPALAVNINGDLGVKEWRRDQPNGMTQRLNLDEKREIAKRANAYPKLVEMLRNIAANEWSATGATPTGKSVSALLRELGEAE